MLTANPQGSRPRSPSHPMDAGGYMADCSDYSVMMWSAHSINETKSGGLPNFAP